MQQDQYIYHFNYNSNESDLCKFESKYLFQKEEQDKLLFSDIKVDPSCSAFIKKRVDVLLANESYAQLIESIQQQQIQVEGFKVEYLVLNGDTMPYTDRLKKLKDIGFSIEGNPDYYHPTITYALCFHAGVWYFGILHKNSFEWHQHKDKPHSYSNSISVSIAKSLVNIATEGDQSKQIIDTCCGVGTILLEACFAGYQIEGCDINWKVCRQSRENLAHFGYSANVYRSDINDLQKKYDAAIIDLPYNLFSHTTDEKLLNIIKGAANTSNRILIVSTTDISNLIEDAGLTLTDRCKVDKIGKGSFNRIIWLCENNKL